MRVISVIVICLIVGTLGVPLRRSELELLERLVKQLVVESASDQDSGYAVNTTWVKAHMQADFKNATVLDVESYLIANEILRLFGDYLADPTIVAGGEAYTPCIELVTSMALMKHFVMGHGKNWLMWQTVSTAVSVVLKEPLDFNTFMKIDEKLPGIIEILTGPTDKALNKLKTSFSNVTGDLSVIEDVFMVEEDHMLMDDEVVKAEEVIIQTLDAMVQLAQSFYTEIPMDKAAETCNTTLPTSVKAYLDESIARLDVKLNDTMILQKVKDLDADPRQRLQKFLLPKIVNKLLSTTSMVTFPLNLMRYSSMLLDAGLKGYGGAVPIMAQIMFQIVLGVEIGKQITLEECRNITEKMKTENPALMDKKLTEVNVNSLKPLLVSLVKAEKSMADENDKPCMPLKMLAMVAGIVETERFKLVSKDNPKMDSLRADIVALLKDQYSSLNAADQQKMEAELNKTVVKVVSKIFISKIIPFLKTLNDLKDEPETIAAEIIPINVMMLAQNISKSNLPIKEALKPLAMLYHAQMDQFITCRNGTAPGGNGSAHGGNGTVHGGNGTVHGGNGTAHSGNGTAHGGNGGNGTAPGGNVALPDASTFIAGLQNANASLVGEPVMQMLNNTCINNRTVCPLRAVMETPKAGDVISKFQQAFADIVKFVTANINPRAEDFFARKMAELMISGATNHTGPMNRTSTGNTGATNQTSTGDIGTTNQTA